VPRAPNLVGEEEWRAKSHVHLIMGRFGVNSGATFYKYPTSGHF